MLLGYPGFEPLLVLVEGEIPVACFAEHGLGAAHGTLGVDEFGGREGSAALLALVAVGTLAVAVGALACDVAVGQEGVCLLVVVLLALFFHKFAFVIECAEEVGCRLAMRLGGGASVGVEGDAEALERLLDEFVVAVDHLLRGAVLLAGTYGDGHAVLVGAADEEHVTLAQPEVTHIDVGGHVDAGQVTYVHAAIGIGQRGRDQRTFEILFHIYIYNIVLNMLLLSARCCTVRP